MGNPHHTHFPLRLGAVLLIGILVGVFMGSDVPSWAKRREVSDQDMSASADEGDMSSQLKLILDNQKRILERLDEVMAELQIVKMRATVR